MTLFAVQTPRIDELRYRIETEGDFVTVRGQRTRELRGATVQTSMGTFPWRKGMSKKFIIAESLGYLAGTVDYDLLKKAAPNVRADLLTPIMAYGPRMKASLARVVRELTKDPSSRRAVIYVARHSDKPIDTPCTLTMSALVREGYLHLDVAMRSWDLVMGLPYDLASFGIVGQALAWTLQLLPGTLTVHASSLHVYDETQHLAVDDGAGEAYLCWVIDANAKWSNTSMLKPATRWQYIARIAKTGLADAWADSWDSTILVQKERGL